MLSSAYAQDFAVQTHVNVEICLKDCWGLKPWSLQSGIVFAVALMLFVWSKHAQSKW